MLEAPGVQHIVDDETGGADARATSAVWVWLPRLTKKRVSSHSGDISPRRKATTYVQHSLAGTDSTQASNTEAAEKQVASTYAERITEALLRVQTRSLSTVFERIFCTMPRTHQPTPSNRPTAAFSSAPRSQAAPSSHGRRVSFASDDEDDSPNDQVSSARSVGPPRPASAASPDVPSPPPPPPSARDARMWSAPVRPIVAHRVAEPIQAPSLRSLEPTASPAARSRSNRIRAAANDRRPWSEQRPTRRQRLERWQQRQQCGRLIAGPPAPSTKHRPRSRRR